MPLLNVPVHFCTWAATPCFVLQASQDSTAIQDWRSGGASDKGVILRYAECIFVPNPATNPTTPARSPPWVAMYLHLEAAIERHRGFLAACGFGPHFSCPSIMIFVLPGTVVSGVAVGGGGLQRKQNTPNTKNGGLQCDAGCSGFSCGV